jgi:hypothetical protein
VTRPNNTPQWAALAVLAFAGLGALIWWLPFGPSGNEPAETLRPVPRYQAEYPAVRYDSKPANNRVTRLIERVESGELALERSERGFLDALLPALEIDPASQLLVFSKTSLQVRTIGPDRPRAIFFNDDTYAAWIPDARNMEIATMDPELGPVFYNLTQYEDETRTESAPEFERRNGRCLRCHDSYSLSGGGVPRFLLGSAYIGPEGELVSHEAHIVTTQRTQIRSRWGGWYVTGHHGKQVHLGNIVVRDPADLQDLEALRIGNRANLDGLLDSGVFPINYSDIVALLVIEHQIDVQNAIARVLFDTVTLLADESSDDAARQARIAEIAEPLVRSLFMVGAATLDDAVVGTSGFAEQFEARGPQDAQGRSLRQLDLETRVFRYPLSYLIYSQAFAHLPEPAKAQVYRRIAEVLDGRDTSGEFEYLSTQDRIAIREILNTTEAQVL